MPNIKPVSDLRNYNEVLRDIAVGEPVFLTKNGRGRYVLIDIEEYEKTKATIKLLSKLSEAEDSIKDEEMWISSEEVRNVLGVEKKKKKSKNDTNCFKRFKGNKKLYF